MRDPHVRLGATASCLQPKNPYYNAMIIVTIVSCSTLRIGPYLFNTEKFIIQFKTRENKIGHHIRFRRNDD